MRVTLCALAFWLAALFPQAASARDVALVVGNDLYQHVPHLAKAVGDARAVSAALTRAGFAVTEAENLDQRGMSQALGGLADGLRDGDRALFYYSGHGFAIDGANYLLPTDVPSADAGRQTLVRDASFPVERIVDDLRQHGAQVAILVLDACRDDPFAGSSTRGLPTTRGLARIEAPDGIFVLTSASPRQAALDSLSDADRDPNSVFTRVFLQELKPGRTMVDIAKRTQVSVKALAATIGFEQMPAYSDQVLGDVVLSPSVAAGGDLEAAQRISKSIPTQIATSANTPAGAGVSLGAGVLVGPGVVIGGKDARIALHPVSPTAPLPQTAMLAPAPLPTAPGGTPPIANFMRSNAGWSVTLSLAEPALSIGYRLSAGGEFHDTGTLDVLDPRTGQRMPNPSLQLSGRTPAGVIDVQYQRPDGSIAGPFPIRFDPDIALFDSQRKALQQIWPSWVEFRDFNGLLVYFTTLVSYRCAITEVRYGLDGASPMSRFDLPPCDSTNPFTIPTAAHLWLKVPTATKSIALQLTWKDGTRSDVNTIEH